MARFSSLIQQAPLEPDQAWQWLAGKPGSSGAQILFSGLVRDENGAVERLFLEQYPGMSEAVLEGLVRELAGQWAVSALLAWHRVGWMEPGETIVLVGVAAAHRGVAFEACECLMDRVKTEVPLWKKTRGPDGEHWVEARQRDLRAARRWRQ